MNENKLNEVNSFTVRRSVISKIRDKETQTFDDHNKSFNDRRNTTFNIESEIDRMIYNMN